MHLVNGHDQGMVQLFCGHKAPPAPLRYRDKVRDLRDELDQFHPLQ